MDHPSEAHPDLTQRRLALLASIAKKVWKKVQRAHRPLEGDGPWGFGCRFNERMRSALLTLSVAQSWIRVIEDGLHFVFCIGAVPARVYRGKAGRPKGNYLTRRIKEVAEQQLAFPFHEQAKWLYRFAIEAASIHAIPELILVQQHAETGAVGEQWVIGKKAKRRVGSPPATDITFVRGAVDQGPPKVTPKKRPGDARNTEE
jgi:hypothetical protein